MSEWSKTLCINLALMCGASIFIVNPLVVGRFIQFADWTVPVYILAVDLMLAAITVCCVLFVKRRRSRYFYISLAGTALLPILMITTELVLTYFDLLGRREQAGNQLQDVHQPDPVLGWTLVPDSVSQHYSAGNYEVSYHIDALGRRTTASDSSAERRLLFFGDSFVFGQGVENENTAAYLLAQRRQDDFKVLNYGVMGYSLEQMFVRFRSIIHEVHMNDVVVFMPLSEDLSRNLIAKHHVCAFAIGETEIEAFPVLKDGEWQSVRIQDECGLMETLALNSHKYLFGKALFHYRRKTLQSELIDNADAIFAQASNLAKSRGANFVVLFLASPKECARQAHQIDLSHLRTPFYSVLPYCPEDSESLEQLRFPTDYHWSVIGNRWAARAIEQILDDALSDQKGER